MQAQIIQAETVNLICFIGSKYQIPFCLDTLSEEYNHLIQQKPLKITFLIEDLKIEEHQKYSQKLKDKYRQQLESYMVNLIPILKESEIQDHISYLKKMNDVEFEFKYAELEGKIQTENKQKMISQICDKKLGWNKEKTKMFVKKNQITEFEDFLFYSKYCHWEQKKVERVRKFIQFCKRKIDQSDL